MKRALVLLLILFLAVPSSISADDRAVKKQLIAELLEIIDTKALVQASFDLVFNRLGEMRSNLEGMELDEEEKQQYAAQMEKQKAEMNAFRERLFTRIDYPKYAEEVYAPLFDKNFTVDELRELIAFYKTKPGQKSARMLPDFALGGFLKGMEVVQETAQQVEQEMRDEDRKKHPWKGTMADIRTLAVAIEARATDVEEYAKGNSVDDIEPLLTPTYVRQVPKTDAWGTKFAYISDGKRYRIVSAGADKSFEWNAKHLEDLPEQRQIRYTEDEDADLVYQDGEFVQAPKAAQQERDY